MKKNALVILLITFSLTGLYFFRVNNPQPVEKNLQDSINTPTPGGVTSILDEPFKHSIPWLQSHTFNSEPIRVVEEGYTGTNFKTWIIEYTAENLKLRALMSIPGEVVDGKAPVLILNHGYINPEEYSTIQSYKDSFDYYAAKGFIVVKPDYRGHDLSEGGKNPIQRYAYAVDVLSLLSVIDTIPEADPSKIYMWGHSMGGDVTLRVLAANSSIRAATLWAPVSVDAPENFLYFVRRNRDADQIAEVENALDEAFKIDDYHKLSVKNYLTDIKTPIIVHHGTSDESVPFDWSVDLETAFDLLEDSNFTLYTYPGEDHNFTHGSRGTVFRRDLNLFSKH